LAKLDAADQEREQAERAAKFDPLHTLDELAELDPLLAAWLARSHGLTWQLPQASIDKALANLEKVRNWILEPKLNGAARAVGSEIVGPAAS